ncbi:hypothetical protein E2C01_091334 [Portunus trituberculatus]|uniref:Uncharacterized protein n=1 Tax=Portunus trituberculatus TaxID=210409 RepID=A0A5B7JP43_PORTR|nr:hypothetical protein [Portunus trituberculatus]
MHEDQMAKGNNNAKMAHWIASSLKVKCRADVFQNTERSLTSKAPDQMLSTHYKLDNEKDRRQNMSLVEGSLGELKNSRVQDKTCSDR